jgi:small-conductance mechanosensitive channel
MMNVLKKIIGGLCIPLALYVGYLLWQQTLAGKIGNNAEEQAVAQWTLLPVSVPILLGLIIFGYYAITGEYDERPV